MLRVCLCFSLSLSPPFALYQNLPKLRYIQAQAFQFTPFNFFIFSSYIPFFLFLLLASLVLEVLRALAWWWRRWFNVEDNISWFYFSVSSCSSPSLFPTPMVQEPPTFSKSSRWNLSTQATSWDSYPDISQFQLPVLQGNTMTLAYKLGNHHENPNITYKYLPFPDIHNSNKKKKVIMTLFF